MLNRCRTQQEGDIERTISNSCKNRAFFKTRGPALCPHRSFIFLYYLRSEKDNQWLAYTPRLAVVLGSYVDGEAHGWAR